MRIPPSLAATAVVLIGLAHGPTAFPQNDWQFPDPYFGILEIEKSHPSPSAERRYRAEVAPPPKERLPARQRQRLFRPRSRPATVGR
jgi:hypothetical protein